MLISIEIDYHKNEAVLTYTDKAPVMLSASKEYSITRFLEWFFSQEHYVLLTDEQFERTMEDTQTIDLKEVA